MNPLLIGGAAAAALLFFSKKAKSAPGGGSHPLPPPNVQPNVPGGLPVPSGGGGGGGIHPLGGGVVIEPGSQAAQQIVSNLPPGIVATFQVETHDQGTSGELNIRQHPNGPSLGTVPHLAVVGWDASPPVDGAGNPTDTNHPPSDTWYHVTDFAHVATPPGIDGFARADFLKAL